MKSFSIYTLLLLFTVTSCRGQSNRKNEVLQAIVDSEQVRNYLHLELTNRSPLYLVKNKFIDDQVEVSVHGQKVRLIENEPDSIENYLQVLALHLDGKNARFELFYKIENMSMKGRLKKINDKWQVYRIEEILEF